MLTVVKVEIREEHRELALQGEAGFSYEYSISGFTPRLRNTKLVNIIQYLLYMVAINAYSLYVKRCLRRTIMAGVDRCRSRRRFEGDCQERYNSTLSFATQP